MPGTQSIPWSNFALEFEYSKDRTGTFDIRTRDQPGQCERFVEFIRNFSTALRTQAATERCKYAPAKKFEQLAKTWTKSDRDSKDTAGFINSEEWNGSAETRKLFSDQEGKAWRLRRRQYCRDTDNTQVQYIDNWIDGSRHWRGQGNYWDTSFIRDEWVTRWTDTWKDLIMEATLVTTPLHQRQEERNMASPDHLRHLDTLFLLAHHPNIPILDWAYEGDSCCNIESGLICVARAALTGYVYLNLLLAMRDQGSYICQPGGEAVSPIDDPYRKQPDEDKRLESPPRYMTTPSWSKLLKEVCNDHEHHAEVMMFEPFLFPRNGENFTVLPTVTFSNPSESYSHTRFHDHSLTESNVIPPSPETGSQGSPDSLSMRGSAGALEEFLNGLWELMVVFEMLWVEQNDSINWEPMCVRQLESCFTGQDGQDWTMFWDSSDQQLTYRTGDLFIDGKIERSSRSE